MQPLGQFLTEVLKPAKVALLYTATPGSTEFAAKLKEILEKQGIKVPVYEKFRPGTPDFSVLLLKVKEQGVDVIVSGGFFPDNLLLARQLREQRLPVKAFIGPWGVAYAKFIRELHGAARGPDGDVCLESRHYPTGNRSCLPGFRETISGKIRPGAQHHHDARLYRRPGHVGCHLPGPPPGRAAHRQRHQPAHFGTLIWLLPMEHLQFQDNGNPVDYRQVIVQIQHDSLVVVYPPDRATGTVLYPLPAMSAN